jgi:hypothetical protein
MALQVGQSVVVARDTASWSGATLEGLMGIIQQIHETKTGELVYVLLDGWDFVVTFTPDELTVQV